MIVSSIETERLVLTPLRMAHACEMVTVLADDSLYEFTGGRPPTLSELENRYQQQIAGSGTPKERWCNWVMSAKSSGCAIGFVQATVTGHSADLAWVLGVRDQGHGLATEAAAAVCEWLRENDVRRVEAHIHPHHLASQAVAKRVGLLQTGLRDDDGEGIWAAELSPNRPTAGPAESARPNRQRSERARRVDYTVVIDHHVPVCEDRQ